MPYPFLALLQPVRFEFAPPSVGADLGAGGAAPPSSATRLARGGGGGRGTSAASLLALVVLAAAVSAFVLDVSGLAYPGWRGSSQLLVPLVAALALLVALHAVSASRRRSAAAQSASGTAGAVVLLAGLDLLAGAFAPDAYGVLAPVALSACMATAATALVVAGTKS
jgi:hypothetical protein